MSIHCDLIDSYGFAPDRRLLQQALDAAIAGEELPDCALTVLLLDEAASDRLHRQHFDVAGATDVMSFPDGTVDPESGRLLLGDLAVCPALASADRDPAEETLLYIVHGLLHLLGYDDTHPADRQAMWARQQAILEPLGITVIDEA